MAIISAIVPIVLLYFSSPFLKDRYDGVQLLRSNAPGKLQNVTAFASHEVRFADKIRNCEDVVLDEENGFALLSCDPSRDVWNTVMGTFIDPSLSGHVYYYPYSVNPNSIPAPLALPAIPKSDFHPLGIDYHPASRTLAVINHTSSGPSISLFRLVPASSLGDVPSLVHIRTLTDPLIHTPNSVHIVSDTEMYVTNDHLFRIRQNPWLAIAETYLAIPGGDVIHIQLGGTNDAPNIKRLARLPFANGVTMLNSTTLAVASTARPGIYIYEIRPGAGGVEGPILSLKQIIKTPYWVDNLTTDSKGRLLMAGHPFPPSLSKVAKTNHQVPSFEPQPKDCDTCGTSHVEASIQWEQRARAPSYVQEWSEEQGARNLYVNDGQEYGCSSTAARDSKRGLGILVGLYERGIMIFKD